MLTAFKSYIDRHQLFQPTDRILLAVSGGIDSVVLSHLCHEIGADFAIAHCNFKLREAESDADAAFVKALAKALEVLHFSVSFETEKLAKEEATSIQIMARELRYDWLEDIRQNLNFDYIATAHHTNDSLETALYNLAKGSGIRGVRGILPKNEKIIHPLLFAEKDQIIHYADQHQIDYREDASNASDKYMRNRIRHHVIPVLKEINPSLEKTAKQTFKNLREVETLYLWAVEEIRKKTIRRKDDRIYLDYALLDQYPVKETVLFELLRPYGFNSSQVMQLLNGGQYQSGAQFLSATHRLLVDHEQYIIGPINKQQVTGETEYFIEKEQEHVALPKGTLTVRYLDHVPPIIPTAKNVACLDAVRVHFPLKLRRWKAGDQFQPFGMNGQHKKVQDYFTDQKLSILEKERVWILESNGVICWIVGYRMDERFRIDETTRHVLVLKWDSEEMGRLV